MGGFHEKTISFLKLTSPNKKYEQQKVRSCAEETHKLSCPISVTQRNRVLQDYRLPASVFSFTLD